MKIVIVHYRFFITGGPERYLFNIIELLEKNGHEIIPFSVKHNKNRPTKFQEYFLDEIGNGEEIYGHEYKRNFKTIFKVIGRMLYSFEAKKKFKRLLVETKPDLIYVLQFQNKISCSIIDVGYSLKVPIIQRISDFGHICIDNIFYQYNKREICEKCLTGSKLNSIKYKCVNNSIVNSFIKCFALFIHDILGTRNKISSYIFPSEFTLRKFLEYGLTPSKLFQISTFFPTKKNNDQNSVYGDFFVYLGRIDPDKGLLTLIKAFENTQYKLVVIGFSIDGYDDELKNYLVGKTHNISFTGHLEFSEMSIYLRDCLCTICPSEWYDNLPNSILESYAFKKPVIATDIGSLRDVVSDGETGILFEYKNIDKLKEAVEYFFLNKDEAARMGLNAYDKISNDYSSTLHYHKLMNVFEDTLKRVTS